MIKEGMDRSTMPPDHDGTYSFAYLRVGHWDNTKLTGTHNIAFSYATICIAALSAALQPLYRHRRPNVYR